MVQDFDEEELAETIIHGHFEDDTPLVVGQSGQLEPVDDDFPSQVDLQCLADYQNVDEPNRYDDEAEAMVLPEDDVDIEDVIVVTSHHTAAPGLPPQQSDCFAGSTPVEQSHQRKAHDLSPFAYALGLYCKQYGVSRTQYTALREVMNLLKQDGLSLLDRLPDTVDTLKRHVHEDRPHIELRQKEVALQPTKLPSSRRAAALINDRQLSQNLYYFNPIDLMQRILSSSLVSSMHFGLAELVDTPTEAWHTMQWASSIRTTSGQFALYPNREPIFPGDIVKYSCSLFDCPTCHQAQPVHTGQVMEVYRDQRDSSRQLGIKGGVSSTAQTFDTVEKGSIVLVIGRIWHAKDLLRNQQRKNEEVRVGAFSLEDATRGELILVANPLELVDPSKVDRRMAATEIAFDYSFESKVSLDQDPHPEKANQIRRVYHKHNSCYLPACKVAPVSGLLEVNQFGRQELVSHFFASPQARSVPIINFNDGFGLYRTMRKSIMGSYLQLASLPKVDHRRQMNVFPLTLGPHGSNFHDVMLALEPLRALDRGLVLKINGEDTFVSTPVFCQIADMPQQQQNSGALGVTAVRGCRSCEITSDKRGDLDWDVVSAPRAHMEIVRLRRELDAIPTVTAKKAFSKDNGLSLEPPAVSLICPALDLIGGRPADPAHSEFGGITKMMHQLLLDVALKPKAIVEYAKILRQMPFPLTWAKIQSPYHVLSYSLQEHARWSVLMTIVCLLWLEEKHLKAPFIRALRVQFQHELSDRSVSTSVVGILTKTMRSIVRMNMLLSADDLTQADHDNFNDIIVDGRRMFQRICEVASNATTLPTGAAAVASRRGSARPRSRATSVASDANMDDDDESLSQQIELDETDDVIDIGQLGSSQKAVKYHQWGSRPNVHSGLHYSEVAQRFGLPSLAMVLPGELKHK